MTTASAGTLWLHRGLLALLMLVAATLFAWRDVEPDLWGHIQYGEDWLFSGSLPGTATHTFTAQGYPWINHENLFELAVAFGHRVFGGHGLMILKCLTGLALLAAMVRFAERRGVPRMTAAVAMVPTTWGLAEFWLMRPQLFSFVFFALLLILLEKAFARWRECGQVNGCWLWGCLPLMIVWTNSHGGFLAGLCVLLAVLGLRSIEAWWRTGIDASGAIVQMTVIACLAVFSIFLNPYGAQLPSWMLMSLRQPRPEVSEWANILEGGPAIVPFVVLTALTLASLKWSTLRKDPVELIVLGLIAVQTLGHVRHLPFFAIAFGFWMPGHLQALWERLVAWRPTLGVHSPLSSRASRLLAAQLLACAVLLSATVIWRLVRFGVDRSVYPVDAIAFMDQHDLQGRLVVTFNWAQYALAALSPSTTVGFDGRYDTCYPPSIVDMHFDLLFGTDPSRRHRDAGSGPIDPERVLKIGQPDLVLLHRSGDGPGVAFVNQHPDWVPLYSDGLAILWGRRSVFDNPDSPRWFAPEKRRLTDARPRGRAAWPAFPGRSGRDAFSPERAAEHAAHMRTRLSKAGAAVTGL